jgi:hypothetical protein
MAKTSKANSKKATEASGMAKLSSAKPAVQAQSEKYTCKVPECNVFWCHDGQVFHDMLDLVSGFDVMSDETFWYHANDQKNDFVCWIVDVIGDVDLGEQLKKVKNRQKAKEVTKQRYYDLTRLEG